LTAQPHFGIFPIPDASQLDTLWEAVTIADQDGLDLIGIQDHPYQRRFVDTFALMAAVVARTDRVTVFPDVANLPLRPPAVLAKASSTIDILSGGRFELGLGAGAFWEGIEAMGGAKRSPGEALQALGEAIDVIRLMWSADRSVRYDGDFYRLAGVKPGPPPAHDIGIWLGVYGSRALRLLGEKADGWVPSIPRMPVAELAAKNAAIDEAAVAAGRDPGAIRRICNVNGVITSGASDGFLRGPADQWIEELTDLAVNQRIDGFVLWPAGDIVQQTAAFAEIAGQVRDAVAAR